MRPVAPDRVGVILRSMIGTRCSLLLPLLSLLALPVQPLIAQQRAQTAPVSAAAPVLVSTSWLADHLRDEKVVVLHVGSENTFAAAHIPGARPMPPASFAVARNGLSTEMPDSAAFVQLLQAAGVANDSRIIIYSPAHPPTLAARLYVTLDRFGLGTQISLLDGGMRAWAAENRAVSREVTAVRPATLTLRMRTDLLVDHAFVDSILSQPAAAILDARDARFFTGEQQNTQRAARAGRVPGAHNVVYSSLVGESGRMLSRDSLAALFTAAGITAGKQVVTYCHVGQQASLAFVAARILGHEVRFYDGSYEDWSKRAELRVETGPPRV